MRWLWCDSLWSHWYLNKRVLTTDHIVIVVMMQSCPLVIFFTIHNKIHHESDADPTKASDL